MIFKGKSFNELNTIEELRKLASQYGIVKEETRLAPIGDYNNLSMPIFSFTFGSKNPEAPTLIITAGVHGLEKVGTHVAIAFLRSLIESLHWDDALHELLSKMRIAIYPLANPYGMYHNKRSNHNGVDLMRNAPIDAKDSVLPMVGGHRVSDKLPWYRGDQKKHPEIETQTLCHFVEREAFHSKRCIAIDIHSGFGLVDRLWFPFATTKSLYPNIEHMLLLKDALDHSLPQHLYKFEPQNLHYLAHGDVWDYLYFKHKETTPQTNNLFLPLCLELGSWHWVKKNPKQLISALGLYNPILPHRLKRAQRRHMLLFDFLIRATYTEKLLNISTRSEKLALRQKALQYWYQKR